eukprot:g4967.t2
MAVFRLPPSSLGPTNFIGLSLRPVRIRQGINQFCPRLRSLATDRKERVRIQTDQPVTIEQLDTLLKNSTTTSTTSTANGDGVCKSSRTDVSSLAPSSRFGVIDYLRSTFGVSARMKGLILLNVMTLIMSTNFVVVKDAQTMIDPFSFSAARFITAAIPFLPFIAKSKPDRQTLVAGLEIGLWSTLGYLTQGLGLLTTDASRVSFLSALTVILVPFIVGVSGKGVSKLAWCSAGIALIGVCLLSGSGGDGVTSSVGFSIGDLFSLASAAFIALQVVRTEHYSRLVPSRSCLPLLGLSMLSVASLSTLMTGVMHADTITEAVKSVLQCPDSFTIKSLISDFSFVPGKALLYTGLISTDVVLLIELIALKDVASTDAAVIYTMEPVLGALWAYLLLGERWGPNGWIGAGLIIIASFATQVNNKI